MKAGVILMSIVAVIAYCLSQIEPKAPLELQSEEPVVVLPVVEGLFEYGWPIHPEDYIALSSPFGKRDINDTGGYGDGFHDGVDMFGTWRARVCAVANGKVIEHWPPPNGYYGGHPVLGGVVAILHDNGAVSRYGHLAKTFVHEGDVVSRGQVIGRQGATGKTGSPHLHFELRIDGELVNPLRYISEELR